MNSHRHWIFGLLFTAALAGWNSTALADEEADFKALVEQHAKPTAIRYFTDREFKLDGDQLTATVKAVDPAKYAHVEIADFQFVSGSANLTLRTTTRFALEGQLTLNRETKNVSGTASVQQDVDFAVDIDFETGSVEVRATDAKFKVKVLEMTPADLPGGKPFATELVETQIDRQKRDLLKDLNEWIEKQQ
jgi:hypothetical protein